MKKLQINDEYAQAFVEICRRMSNQDKVNTCPITEFTYGDVKDTLPTANALLKMRGNGWIRRKSQGAGHRPTSYQLVAQAYAAAVKRFDHPDFTFTDESV